LARRGRGAETTITCKKGLSGYYSAKTENWGGIIIKQGSAPADSTIVTPRPAEPADSDVRTFADIENGEPDSVWDEVGLDIAII
jgi:hypothetical protein